MLYVATQRCTLVLVRMGAGRGGKGVHLHPLEFENDDVICCLQGKFPKICARASIARINCP